MCDIHVQVLVWQLWKKTIFRATIVFCGTKDQEVRVKKYTVNKKFINSIFKFETLFCWATQHFPGKIHMKLISFHRSIKTVQLFCNEHERIPVLVTKALVTKGSRRVDDIFNKMRTSCIFWLLTKEKERGYVPWKQQLSRVFHQQVNFCPQKAKNFTCTKTQQQVCILISN